MSCNFFLQPFPWANFFTDCITLCLNAFTVCLGCSAGKHKLVGFGKCSSLSMRIIVSHSSSCGLQQRQWFSYLLLLRISEMLLCSAKCCRTGAGGLGFFLLRIHYVSLRDTGFLLCFGIAKQRLLRNSHMLYIIARSNCNFSFDLGWQSL